MTTDTTSAPRLAMVTIDCDDAGRTAHFWTDLLDGQLTEPAPGYFMVEAGGTVLGFGNAPDLQRPSWPDAGHKQFHLDLSVDDLDAASARAQELGATLADPQPEGSEGRWVVLIDPSGHPFCLAVWG